MAVSAPAAAAKAHASAAASSKAKKRVLVGVFDGPKSADARKAVIAALKDDDSYDVGETKAAKPGGDEKSYASASSGASAVLVGHVKKGGLVLSVRNGADGALVRDLEIKGDTSANLSKNISDTLGVSVADALAQTTSSSETTDTGKESAASSADEGKPAEEASPSGAPSSAASEASPYPDAHSPFEIEAGLRAVHRSFTWHDTPAQLYPASMQAAPATYNLPLGPAVYVGGTLYPVAFATRGFAGNFGITGGYERNFATSSVHDEGAAREGKLTTDASQYFVGLKLRVPVGSQQFALLGAYGKQTFELKGDEAAPFVPDVAYKFIRVAAEARLRFDAVTVGLHVGTRIVTDTGALESVWFPHHVKTQSLEAGISAGYTVISNLDVVFGFDLTRYAFDFNPITVDSPVKAGGAVDQYVSGSVGLRYSLRSHSQ